MTKEKAEPIEEEHLVECCIRFGIKWSLLLDIAAFCSSPPNNWLGKNSRRSEVDKILAQLHGHTRGDVEFSKSAMALDYSQRLQDLIPSPLVMEVGKGVMQEMANMNIYVVTYKDIEGPAEYSVDKYSVEKHWRRGFRSRLPHQLRVASASMPDKATPQVSLDSTVLGKLDKKEKLSVPAPPGPFYEHPSSKSKSKSGDWISHEKQRLEDTLKGEDEGESEDAYEEAGQEDIESWKFLEKQKIEVVGKTEPVGTSTLTPKL